MKAETIKQYCERTGLKQTELCEAIVTDVEGQEIPPQYVTEWIKKNFVIVDGEFLYSKRKYRIDVKKAQKLSKKAKK